MGAADLDAVVASLQLEELDLNLYRATSPDWERGRLFGGTVAAQSLAAAYETVEDLHVHSLHSYFLRPGDPSIPVILDVDRIRDGRSFTTRRVVARQRGEAIFNLATSFHKIEAGPEHQVDMPDIGSVDDFPTAADHGVNPGDFMPRHWKGAAAPIEVRRQMGPMEMPEVGVLTGEVWQRAFGTLPDDQATHRIMLTYMSDLSLLGTSIRAHVGEIGEVMAASLDHALWFHRDVKADDWLLYSLNSPSASNARGFNLGHYFAQDGTLVASSAQEGLIRPIAPSAT
jgi:acyl-CoA thioesterase-2